MNKPDYQANLTPGCTGFNCKTTFEFLQSLFHTVLLVQVIIGVIGLRGTWKSYSECSEREYRVNIGE